jgi:hypothetical protein
MHDKASVNSDINAYSVPVRRMTLVVSASADTIVPRSGCAAVRKPTLGRYDLVHKA